MYAPDDEEFELNQARVLLEKDVSSVVWFPVEPKKHVSVASLFRKNQIPVVICEKVAEQFESPWLCVRSDYYSGTQNALQTLIDQGHQRIAYVGPKGTESDFGPVHERWNAYKNFMKERDLWNPDELVFQPSLFKEWPVHVSRLENQFQRTKAPTAILAYDDVIALEAMRGLQSIGLRIPDDIAIIGHGGLQPRALLHAKTFVGLQLLVGIRRYAVTRLTRRNQESIRGGRTAIRTRNRRSPTTHRSRINHAIIRRNDGG